MSPIEEFPEHALMDFEQYLVDEKNLEEGARKHRLRGARLFKEFILGRKYAKYERVLKRPKRYAERQNQK